MGKHLFRLVQLFIGASLLLGCAWLEPPPRASTYREDWPRHLQDMMTRAEQRNPTVGLDRIIIYVKYVDGMAQIDEVQTFFIVDFTNQFCFILFPNGVIREGYQDCTMTMDSFTETQRKQSLEYHLRLSPAEVVEKAWTQREGMTAADHEWYIGGGIGLLSNPDTPDLHWSINMYTPLLAKSVVIDDQSGEIINIKPIWDRR